MSTPWGLRAAILVGVLGASVLAWPSGVADHPGTLVDRARLDGPAENQNIVYHWTDIDAAFDRWESSWPALVDRLTIGRTASGFDLLTVRITDESVPYATDLLSSGEKTRVYLDGSHHGNEYLGTELIMYYLEGMLDGASSGDPEASAFLQRTEIYATPIVNVDGNLLDTRKNSRLVDPNRNYPYKWGAPGAGADPSSQTYRGPSAWSEAETKANGAFIEKIRPDLLITMHTGVAEFYWPWGWTKTSSPDDGFFTSLEKPFEKATNGRVDAMPGWKLYIVSGASDDWSYGTLGVPSFTFEVHELQFLPVYPQPIPDIIRDQLNGLDFMVKNVERMGAWIEPRFVPGGVQDGITGPDRVDLENLGWGNATRVQVALGERIVELANVPHGESVSIELDPGDPREVAVTYQVMQIETSPLRTHRLAMALPLDAIADAVDAPSASMLAALAAGLAATVFLRRRPA